MRKGRQVGLWIGGEIYIRGLFGGDEGNEMKVRSRGKRGIDVNVLLMFAKILHLKNRYNW